MSHTHAVASRSQPAAGQCSWIHSWEDVDIRCTDEVVPGERLCAEHLIAAAKKRSRP
jgi:hypothetical protein